MTTEIVKASPRVSEVLRIAQKFTAGERLILAKLLLDSLMSDEVEDRMDWQGMGLASFEKDWDNPDDAVYDNGLPPVVEKMAALDMNVNLWR